MLRKLRNKVVLTNLIFVGVLLIIVSIGVCMFVADGENRNLSERLNVAIRYVSEAPERDFMRSFGFGKDRQREGLVIDDGQASDSTVPPLPDGTPPSFDAAELPNSIDGAAFSVLLDSEGNIVQKKEFFASMDDESLDYALKKVEASGKDSGVITELDLAYAKKVTAKGTAIAFTSRSEEIKTIRSAIIIAVCADLVTMVFIALISFRIASLSVKPVQEAWDNEKRFIADASHELKTPLTVILANNSILESGITDPQHCQWLESNRYEAERMQKLIEEMLFLAKSDEGGYKMTLGEVNVSEIAEHCCLSFEPVAFDQGVMIESSIEPDIRMTTDASMVEKVLGVLVDNAVKHSPAGGTVDFSMTSDGRNVHIAVSNGGDPIPPESLPHIFERFYKADSSRTADSAKSGFGLGLAIAHDIVEKLGGTIAVKSNEEEGTVFTVCLKNS